MSDDAERLRRRAARERKARLDAEAVAESTTRELYQTVQKLEATHKNLVLLERAAVAANEATTFDEAASRVLSDVLDATGWTLGHVYVTDESGRRMRPTAVWHVREEAATETFRRVTEATELEWGQGLPGRVLATGESAWIVDVTRDGNFPRAALADEIGVRGAFGFPVVVGGRVAAVLEFFTAEPAEPDEALLAVMAHIGTQLGRVVERTRAEDALRSSETQNRLIVETADDAFVAIDPASRILDWNHAAERTFGWAREEVLGLTLPDTIIPERHRDAHLIGLARFLSTGEGAVIGRRIEITARRRDGSELPVELTPWVVRGEDGVRFNAFISDITERKEFERQLRHQALHDALTGLPNRALLMDRLAHALARCRRESCITAVLFIDLDRFKAVNDNFGHDAGDQLLLAVASRLPDVVRPGDTVARLGGDEFVVLCEGLSNRRDAVDIAERVVTAIQRPVAIQGMEMVVAASVGVAINEGDGDPEQVLGDADLAMYRAKERRSGVYELFDESMRLRAAERLSLENDLRAAVVSGALVAHYQPIVRLADGRWTGTEALVRWHHPQRGTVAPSEFIPVAEETGLIGALGEWMLEQSCRQHLAWRAAHGDSAPRKIAVNVSVRQLEQDEFVAQVRGMLTRLRFPPDELVLEVTESAVMRDQGTVVDHLAALREIGVRLAVDDFGTGYSSLARIDRLPVDTLKVDRSLVGAIDATGGGEALVSAAIAIGQSLGLGVIAEGIETRAQLDAIRRLGCEEGQGYLLARPMAANAIDAALRSGEPPVRGAVS